MRVISPLDLRRSLGAILDAASAGERFLVERDRRPVAMLVSVEDGQRLEPDADEARRRRLAALDRLEGLAATVPSLAVATGSSRPAAATRAVAVPVAAVPAAAAPAPPLPLPPPRFAAPAAPPPSAASLPMEQPRPPAASRDRSAGPRPPSPEHESAPAGTSPRTDRHQAERRRHAGEGLVGIG